MKLILESWRKYLTEAEDSFSYMSASPWGSAEAEEEWGEEIKTALAEGDEHIGQRWPGLSEEVIEKAYPFLLGFCQSQIL